MSKSKRKKPTKRSEVTEAREDAACSIQERLTGILVVKVRGGDSRQAQGIVAALDAIDEMFFQVPF